MNNYILNKIIKKIPNLLLNNSVLLVNNKEFRIIEIEFYVNSDEHQDKYTHCSSDQFKYGLWYFHKFKNGSYKSGTFKGLDLTLGSKDIAYGILIRSIQDLSDGKITEGCCNCVNKILSEYKCETISDFSSNKDLSCINNDRNFVIKDKKLPELTIYDGKRVGLSNKYPDFRDKKYRFAVLVDCLKKHVKYFNSSNK
jgi:3-methyladenine DNA glycosylase Mpg